MQPEKDVWDLSQNIAAKRGRSSLVDGAIPCLATSSLLWCNEKQRIMLGSEMLALSGVPVTPRAAAASVVDVINVSDISENAKRAMAGNSMHVASVGAVMLLAFIGVEAL